MPPATSESSPGLETSLCGAADRGDQARLYERCFGKEDGERVVRWRYEGNPHGEAISLLTRDAERQPVSGYACSPRLALAQGEEASAATIGQTGDVMTHPDWRGKGLFSALDRAAVAEAARRGWPVVFGLPNRKSERLFTEKLGWKLVGRIRPWTFVLVAGEGARRERLRAGRLAALGVAWAAWRGTMARGRLQGRAWEKVNTLAIRRFDAQVDALSREVEPRHSLMVRRDHAYLNWRFLDAPSGLFRAHGVYQPTGELCGYAIVQLPRRGEAAGYLVEVLARDEVALAAAIDAALGHLAKAAASVARSWAIEGSWWERSLRAAGFRAPKREDFKAVIAYVNEPDHPLARAALDPSGWYFTDGDRDDETVG